MFPLPSKLEVRAWERLGNPGWDWPTFEKALKQSYTLYKPDGTIEGNGPLQVNVSEPTRWLNIWADTLNKLGYPRCDPFSGEACGSIIMPESIDPEKKQRSSSANAYLGTARSRDNLVILTGAAVTKIILNKTDPENILVKGVQISKDGQTKNINASREVVVSAGSINSPRLLELSGIGDATLLKDLGIDVAINNPNVGENLQNHVMSLVVFDIQDDEDSLNPLVRHDPQAIAAAQAAYQQGSGPLSSSNGLASAQMPMPKATADEMDGLLVLLNASQNESKATPEFSAAHSAFLRSLLEDPKGVTATYISSCVHMPVERGSTAVPPGDHYSIGVLLSHPLSRGHAHITSADPSNVSTAKGVEVDPRYLSHPLDIEVLAHHLRFIEQSMGRTEPFAGRLKPREDLFADLEAAKDYIRRTSVGANHLTGTCSMMPRHHGGVVDEKLRVYGCSNLRVCDASILPVTPRANIQSSVYGVAEMCASFIKQCL